MVQLKRKRLDANVDPVRDTANQAKPLAARGVKRVRYNSAKPRIESLEDSRTSVLFKTIIDGIQSPTRIENVDESREQVVHKTVASKPVDNVNPRELKLRRITLRWASEYTSKLQHDLAKGPITRACHSALKEEMIIRLRYQWSVFCEILDTANAMLLRDIDHISMYADAAEDVHGTIATLRDKYGMTRTSLCQLDLPLDSVNWFAEIIGKMPRTGKSFMIIEWRVKYIINSLSIPNQSLAIRRDVLPSGEQGTEDRVTVVGAQQPEATGAGLATTSILSREAAEDVDSQKPSRQQVEHEVKRQMANAEPEETRKQCEQRAELPRPDELELLRQVEAYREGQEKLRQQVVSQQEALQQQVCRRKELLEEEAARREAAQQEAARQEAAIREAARERYLQQQEAAQQQYLLDQQAIHQQNLFYEQEAARQREDAARREAEEAQKRAQAAKESEEQLWALIHNTAIPNDQIRLPSKAELLSDLAAGWEKVFAFIVSTSQDHSLLYHLYTGYIKPGYLAIFTLMKRLGGSSEELISTGWQETPLGDLHGFLLSAPNDAMLNNIPIGVVKEHLLFIYHEIFHARLDIVSAKHKQEQQAIHEQEANQQHPANDFSSSMSSMNSTVQDSPDSINNRQKLPPSAPTSPEQQETKDGDDDDYEPPETITPVTTRRPQKRTAYETFLANFQSGVEDSTDDEEDSLNVDTRKVCEFFLKSRCKFGDKCRNIHPPASVKSQTRTFTPSNALSKSASPLQKPQANSKCEFAIKHGYCRLGRFCGTCNLPSQSTTTSKAPDQGHGYGSPKLVTHSSSNTPPAYRSSNRDGLQRHVAGAAKLTAVTIAINNLVDALLLRENLFYGHLKTDDIISSLRTCYLTVTKAKKSAHITNSRLDPIALQTLYNYCLLEPPRSKNVVVIEDILKDIGRIVDDAMIAEGMADEEPRFWRGLRTRKLSQVKALARRNRFASQHDLPTDDESDAEYASG